MDRTNRWSDFSVTGQVQCGFSPPAVGHEASGEGIPGEEQHTFVGLSLQHGIDPNLSSIENLASGERLTGISLGQQFVENA